VANPAKRFKDTLRQRKNTRDLLFTGFEYFKNWDTRIVGSQEEAMEI
jgi:hypothetical protein